MDTNELIQCCLSGDEAAIETLVHAHQRAVFVLALSLLYGRGVTPAEAAADADEATQDIFIAVLKSLHTYQGKAAFTTWLYAITLNICRNRYRRRQASARLRGALQNLFRQSQAEEQPTGAIELPPPPSPEETVLRREAAGVLWGKVNRLGEKHRTVVILRYYHDLSIAEIAQILGLSEGTVHSRLFTARERLRVLMADSAPASALAGVTDDVGLGNHPCAETLPVETIREKTL